MALVALTAAPACSSDAALRPDTAAPGVVFTFPADGQLDVPTGARVLVTFSEPVTQSALGACSADGAGGLCLVGPSGPVAKPPAVVGDGMTVEFPAGELEAGAMYELHVGPALAPFAENLPATGPLVRFRTRSTRPRAAAPTVIGVNGSDPAQLGQPGARPMFESSTIQLVFSEPLDPRSVSSAASSVALVAGGTAVPATVIAEGIHVSIDPREDLTPGTTYQLQLGNQIKDLAGQALVPVSFDLVPQSTRGEGGAIPQVLRTRLPGDPGPTTSRAGTEPNVIALDKPLIGREMVQMGRSVLAAELADPTALGGPIAFTIRRGQRLTASGLDVKLGGKIPVGLSTGELQIELLTDGGGRIFRNPHQAAEQRPNNGRAPLYVELSMDLAVFATDPTGTAVLTQTVLGVQGSGTVIATDGVLAIETVASMDLGLLGVTSAPSNLVLELITSPDDTPPVDTQGPKLVATYPAEGTAELLVDAGIELVFDEPVDLDRLRAGGVKLEEAAGAPVAAAIESHGSAVVVRPLAPLAYGTSYRVLLADVADVAGNALAATSMVQVSTPVLPATTVPPTVIAISPGVPCSLTGGTAMTPGRCSGGDAADSTYRPFTLEREQPIEVELSQPLRRSSVTLGATCNAGSVRVEELSMTGTCVRAVPGSMLIRNRGFAFVPDQPWATGTRYRLALVSGNDAGCAAGELCGENGVAASFDPLSGAENGDAGGPNLTIDFTGAAPSGATAVFSQTSPWTDMNGSGAVEANEVRRDQNRALMRITGTTGNVTSAEFTSPDCLPGTPEKEACMYLLGALPVALGEVTSTCPLPGGATADACVPITMSAQAMYATSIAMHAVVTSTGISINVDADTKTAVMRIRDPASGPVTGFIIDGGTGPKMVVALDLYMDAPDMDLPLSTHDLHSKPLTASLEGPVSFLPDGRIAIEAANMEDLPVEVRINAPLGITGTVKMVVPKNEMKLRLLSRPLRGVER
ncbi:MAG TPA: Ig-like domain-containing protein [Kofleriaceae bacterium]|nr:Ig-like domain-containing protein [Kofleriaceae bacterium]